MGYYQGDYYRGDYYRGDNLFSRALKGAGRAVAALIPGGGLITTGISMASSLTGPKKKVTASTSGAIKDPGIKGIIRRVLPGGMTGYHRHRRMNVTNVRALRRAIRRAHGFAKLARSVMTFPIQKPPKGRALFKKRRRAR